LFLVSTVVNKLLMKPLVKITVEREKKEGDFRFKHLQIRCNAESLAFHGSAAFEQSKVNNKLSEVCGAQQSLYYRNYVIDLSVNTFAYIGAIASYLVISVPIFSGAYDNLAHTMPPAPKKTKEAIAKAAQAGGGKGKKKKWSKAKSKEKLANMVLFSKELYDKVVADVPKQRLITPSNLSEKFKLSGSLARKIILHLFEKGLIRKVSHHNSQMIFTRAAAPVEEPEAEAAAPAKGKKGGKKEKAAAAPEE